MLGECHISFFILSALHFYLTLSILGCYSDLGVSANLHISFYPPYIKELSASHSGRRSIKYSDKITYNFDGEKLSNAEFFRIARKKLGLNWESCWFIYEMNVCNLDELHFKAVIVNKEYSESYHDSAERKEKWLSLIDK